MLGEFEFILPNLGKLALSYFHEEAIEFISDKKSSLPLEPVKLVSPLVSEVLVKLVLVLIIDELIDILEVVLRELYTLMGCNICILLLELRSSFATGQELPNV